MKAEFAHASSSQPTLLFHTSEDIPSLQVAEKEGGVEDPFFHGLSAKTGLGIPSFKLCPLRGKKGKEEVVKGWDGGGMVQRKRLTGKI